MHIAIPLSMIREPNRISSKHPADLLDTPGEYYEVTILESNDFGDESHVVIRGEFRGWDYDSDRGIAYAIIAKMGETRGYEYHREDIVAVKQVEKFFEPYKGREISIGQRVDIYKNLHLDNGYSIRCSKTGLVLAHCSTVLLKNASFHVSESGRQKTVKEKRKRVHAYVRGELVAVNTEFPQDFVKVLYNPYLTEFFLDSTTRDPIYQADEVFFMGRHAYRKNRDINLFSN
ncbi:hypothetical protein AWM68_17545 [Fictibacillus phosphorivorans]|uniref:Uncharacterized protein n=1 Tax=Fictibacillus phosphorivorans TaxID=1221500 RepID=A0A161RUP3_9BACL|nr:hypothetical protein [Fictibacillus phosphorivorans]KZE67976.1 hypothetical protein AWM68_17545 [Fictibacillus phosphorivorans]